MSAWTVAMPAETQFGIMAMILGGAFDRNCPRFAHLLRARRRRLPHLFGRLENAWHRRVMSCVAIPGIRRATTWTASASTVPCSTRAR